MLKRKIVLGIILYSFLYTIPRDYPLGKRGRKNIMKALKKQLSIYNNKKGQKKYMVLIKDAEVIMANVKVTFSGEELSMLNPGALFAQLEKNYSEYLDIFDFNPSWIKDLKDSYLGTGDNTFTSIKYTNKLILEIEENIKDMH